MILNIYILWTNSGDKLPTTEVASLVLRRGHVGIPSSRLMSFRRIGRRTQRNEATGIHEKNNFAILFISVQAYEIYL